MVISPTVVWKLDSSLHPHHLYGKLLFVDADLDAGSEVSACITDVMITPSAHLTCCCTMVQVCATRKSYSMTEMQFLQS